MGSSAHRVPPCAEGSVRVMCRGPQVEGSEHGSASLGQPASGDWDWKRGIWKLFVVWILSTIGGLVLTVPKERFWTRKIPFCVPPSFTFGSRSRVRTSSRGSRGGSVGPGFRRTGPGSATGANLSPIPWKTAPRGALFGTPIPPQPPRP